MTRLHPLVHQLHFARSEFQRCLSGLTAVDAERRLLPNNSISWIIGHLANQEQFYWVVCGQGQAIAPTLNDLVGYGRPATTPPYDEMQATWQTITATADTFLATLTAKQLTTHLQFNDKPTREAVGTMLLRNIYHYWFHLGEVHAIRQQLGHKNLPDFVGNMSQFGYSGW